MSKRWKKRVILDVLSITLKESSAKMRPDSYFAWSRQQAEVCPGPTVARRSLEIIGHHRVAVLCSIKKLENDVNSGMAFAHGSRQLNCS